MKKCTILIFSIIRSLVFSSFYVFYAYFLEYNIRFWIAVENWINLLLFKLAALPMSILALFLVYWLLPNRKIDPVQVAPVAILVGLGLEALKYVNILLFPLLRDKLGREYGVFQHSAMILLWSFVAALLVLAGAEWAARRTTKVSVS